MTNNGKSNNSEEALVIVNCPFCGIEIVRAYDHSMLPDDLDDEEIEEIISNAEDIADGICDHLAFRSDWAYAGSEFTPKMEKTNGKSCFCNKWG